MAGKIISTNLEASEKAAYAALPKLISCIRELRSRKDISGLQLESLGGAQKKLTDGAKAVADARKGYAEKKKKLKETLTKMDADLVKAQRLLASIRESFGDPIRGGAVEAIKYIQDAIKAADGAEQATVAS